MPDSPVGLGVKIVADMDTLSHPTLKFPGRSLAHRPPSMDQESSSFALKDDTTISACDLQRELGDGRAESTGTKSSLSCSDDTTESHQDFKTSDSGFSRHDSLFSFGVSSSRNAAELRLLLGGSSSRLKPGATVLSLQDTGMGKETKRAHAVSLEQAKPRARVEVDIVLESNCCIEDGYMRGNVKIRIRKRQKKEAAVLLAQGKVRVIGFEYVPGEADRHTFYQRASPLSAITDTYSGIYDSPPDVEGFSRAMEGVHVLPFAMHLPIDKVFGSAKGSLSLQSGAAIRYIAIVSVKVKDSNTGKRSIAHFYRDCQVWPRLNPSVVLASAPRPIQAATAKSLSMIGNGSKLKLTAMLHRMTWLAGQRCHVRVWIANDTKKSVRSVVLTLVRTTTLFKPKPHLNPGKGLSVDPDACQTSTTHKVVAETVLERSQVAAKGHASTEGWWTGVQAGQEAQFSHYVLLPPEELSVTRSRLIEVEYSMRVTASAGALAPDVHVTLPVRIINFLSVDPTPSAPLLAPDGSYARLVPYAQSFGTGSESLGYLHAPSAIDHHDPSTDAPYDQPSVTCIPSLAALDYHRAPAPQPDTSMVRRRSVIALNTPTGDHATTCVPSIAPASVGSARQGETGYDKDEADDLRLASSSESNSSVHSADSETCSASPERQPNDVHSHERVLGNFELDDDAGSDEEVDYVVGTAQINTGCFLKYADPGDRSDVGSGMSHRQHSDGEAYAQTSFIADPDCGSSSSLKLQCNSIRSRASDVPSKGRDRRIPSPLGARPRVARLIALNRTSSLEHIGSDVSMAPHSSSWEDPNGESSAVWHDREGASSEALPGESGDEDEGATPRLPASVTTSIPGSGSIIPSSSTTASESGSYLRPSRQLPQPPPRPSQLRDINIPASVSALEVLHMSQIRSSCPDADASVAAEQPVSTSGSMLSRSTAHRSLPASPVRSKAHTLLSSTSSGHPMLSRPSHKRSETVPSVPAYGRPSGNVLHQTGQSACSIVKGRIAAFEERLKVSLESGVAYA